MKWGRSYFPQEANVSLKCNFGISALSEQEVNCKRHLRRKNNQLLFLCSPHFVKTTLTNRNLLTVTIDNCRLSPRSRLVVLPEVFQPEPLSGCSTLLSNWPDYESPEIARCWLVKNHNSSILIGYCACQLIVPRTECGNYNVKSATPPRLVANICPQFA